MTRINMTRRNELCNIAVTRDSIAWGSIARQKNAATASWFEAILANSNALIFSAVLIVCSLAVGCSSEKPKPVTSNNQIPVTQSQSQLAPAPAPVVQAASKPAPKKAAARKPATVNYTNASYGLTFEYPRRYAIETGDAATDLVLSNPIPMNFVQPGGVALAAVELPETGFANTDFSSAFFNVSVNKSLTVEQCGEFAVPQPKESVTSQTVTSQTKTDSAPASTESPKPAATVANSDTQGASVSPTCHPEDGTSCGAKDLTTSAVATGASGNSTPNANSPDSASNGKLLVGDLELSATEAVSGEGPRQSDSRYFHVFENGACYEFALNVTTVASDEGMTKHVDRDKVFDRLEKILATVKINSITPEATADAPSTMAAPTAAATPAQ